MKTIDSATNSWATGLINKINAIDKTRFAICITVLFAIVVGIGMHYHEMWRDELEWFMRRKYDGIIGSGDPCYIIYNAILYFSLLISPSEWMFQLIHLLIIVAAVAILLFSSPFNNIEKLLFSFGYYFVYEYGVIARYYGFLVLLIFLILHFVNQERRNYIFIALLILVLAEHNPSATIISASLTVYIVLDVFNKIKCGTIIFKNNFNLIFGSIILLLGWMLLGIVFYFYLFKLYSAVNFNGGTPPLFTAMNEIWNGYMPIPDLSQKVRFWWTNIIEFPVAYPPNYHFEIQEMTWQYATAFTCSFIIISIIISKLIVKPLVLITFLLNTFVYSVFLQHFMRAYTIRYLGLLFIIFIYCYWLFYKADSKLHINLLNKIIWLLRKTFIPSLATWISKAFKPLLYIVLITQVFCAVYALSKDRIYKFTFSEDAAQFIKWCNLENTHVMVGYPDYAAQCISAHLDKPIFYPQVNKFKYFSGCFDKNFKQTVDVQEIIGQCASINKKENKNILLILNFPLVDGNRQILQGSATISNELTLELIKSFSGDVINSDEQFFLYEIKPLNSQYNVQ